MKLQKANSSTSFYETFSDLIFATMAIFVLIIIVLIILVQPKKIIDTKSLEMVVAIDGSRSMGPPLEELQGSVNSLAEAVPLITPEFHLGMIIYRDQNDVFSMKRIMPEESDGGSSLNSVYGFTGRMNPINSVTDIEGTVKDAISMFSDSERRKILVIIGDIGPYEVTRNCDEVAAENRVYRDIQRALDRFENLRLFSLYSQAGGNLACGQQTRRFFEKIAEVAGSRGAYSNDDRKILAFLLKGILGS